MDGETPRRGVQSDDSDLTWLAYHPDEYDQLLSAKVDGVRQRFAASLGSVQPAVCRSPAEHYRQRCRFAVRPFDGRLSYALFDRGAPTTAIEDFPVGSRSINALMPSPPFGTIGIWNSSGKLRASSLQAARRS